MAGLAELFPSRHASPTIAAKSLGNAETYRNTDTNVTLMESGSLVQPGRQFEFFETVEELAGLLEVPERPSMTAGYADIYQGFWTSPQGGRVQVAIKQLRTIPKDRQTEMEALKWKADMRLKREVFVWSQTTHPNLHPLLGYRSQPQPQLISPWCSDGNLKDYLRANPGFTRCDKLRLIFQTACGLEHLHSRTPPICHGDIKPENVLINDLHGPALSDFGLSRVIQDLEARSGFTTSETVKGTFRYMARELFAGQKPNLEADVYAFGGLILTVMSGKAPFDGLLHQVMLRRVMLDEPPIPKEHSNLSAHDPLWKLMRRCWDSDSAARPTMRDVLMELLGQIDHEESNSGSRLGASVTENGTNESRNADLDIPSALRHGRNLPLFNASSGPAGHSLSGVPIVKAEHNAVSGKLLLAARKTFKTMQLTSKVIPVIGKYIGAAAEVGLSLLEIVEAMNPSENLSDSLNPWRLANMLQDLGEWSRKHRGDDIRARITEIQKELEVAQGKIRERYSSNLIQSECSSFDHASPERCQGTVQKVLEEIHLLVTLNTTGLVNEFENTEIQERNRRLLNCLGDGNYGAQGNAIEDAICLPGTRVEILERIDNWIRDTSNPDPVLWIRGMAGRGKSTIASTVAHNWRYRASCAIFHFRRGHNTLNERIVCTLARQLGSSVIPEVRNAVLESLQENEDIANQRLVIQFETLFVVPLSKLIDQSRTILIVVDALDESQNPKDAMDFVKLIDQHSSSFPANVKFLLTCRPEAQLLRALEPRKWPVEDLDRSVNVVNDLARFIKQGCTQIREDHGLPEDWPASSDVMNLVEMSQGLFQWAQTVIMYISNGSPINRLRDLLKRPLTWNGLDDLYHQILSKAFDQTRLDPTRQELLHSILGTLVVAPFPLSLDAIAAIYSDNSAFQGVDQEGVIEYLRQDILVDLNSLLLMPASPTEFMHLMHTSIRDLLVSMQRCKGRAYYIDIGRHHERLASLCLGVMVRSLKENVCNLSDFLKPNSEVQDVIGREVSPAIRYCCRAWSVHLTEGTQWSRLATESTTSGQRADFETFSKEKLLHWLEVMSLVGATAEAMIIAKRVYLWLSRHVDENSDSKSLATLWSDAQRFIAAFSEPISFGAFHIYASALGHCPPKTELWKWYGKHAKIRTLRGVQPLTWPANLWTRSASPYSIAVVAFSPDGAVLASGSSDGTIQLWDAQTGSPLNQVRTKCGGFGVSGSVAFSPDGRFLVSGSAAGAIQWWDAQTGSPLGQSLAGHDHSAWSVAFPPEGWVPASGFEDGMIRLWDAPTGFPSMSNRGDFASSVAFSPDGRVLASGFEDGTVRLWDAQTGSPLGQPLTGHSDRVLSVVFSLDSRVLASLSDDSTIRLWDAQTGSSFGQPLTGHHLSRCIAFSPDGRVLASESDDDGMIRMWDTQTGSPLGQPMLTHDVPPFSAAFSPDGRIMAFGFDDGMIRLWDAQTGSSLGQPLPNHASRAPSCIAFSPDSSFLASGSEDGTIRLWDAQTGTAAGQPPAGPGCSVDRVALSPNGNALVCVSRAGISQLWDARTVSPLGQPLTDHNGSAWSIAFSLDGKILASGSKDGTTRLWDAQTGYPLGQPLGHGDSAWSVAFSPDGRFLASGSEGGTIQMWDAQTGSPSGQPLTGHVGYIWSLTFSPDGEVLASVAEDGTIRLWDAQIGSPLGQPLTGHNVSAWSVAFSPDGRVLASGFDDGTIRLWDVQTRSPLGQPLTGHRGGVYSVIFSPDNRILASGGHGTIQLWDTQTWSHLELQMRSRCDMLSFVPISRADSNGPLKPTYHVPNIDDHWVKLSSSHLLWLPFQYWTDDLPTVLLSNGTLVIVSEETLSIFDVSHALQH